MNKPIIYKILTNCLFNIKLQTMLTDNIILNLQKCLCCGATKSILELMIPLIRIFYFENPFAP